MTRQIVTLFPNNDTVLGEKRTHRGDSRGEPKACWKFYIQQKRVSVPAQAVKSFRVAIAHRVLVCFGEPAVFIELFELCLTGLVVDFVREVRREDERLVADEADSEGKSQLVAFDTDENTILVNMALYVVRDGLLVAQLQKAPARIVLYVAVPRALESLDAVDEPTRSGLHEAEANFGIFVEHAVKRMPAKLTIWPNGCPNALIGAYGLMSSNPM